MLRTMPERMYWKQEMRKRTVFSEFSMLDFCFFVLGGMNQGCRRTASKAMAWMRMHMVTWPKRGARTFRETRLAVGRLRQRLG